ncbi:hypothetical protein C8R44DRAFT_745509 [Mycena epipterygia]|nr:hypothetical protein C8R44DRAFT_745509 [Mycena epipterygia]
MSLINASHNGTIEVPDGTTSHGDPHACIQPGYLHRIRTSESRPHSMRMVVHLTTFMNDQIEASDLAHNAADEFNTQHRVRHPAFVFLPDLINKDRKVLENPPNTVPNSPAGHAVAVDSRSAVATLICTGGFAQEIACTDIPFGCSATGVPPVTSDATCAVQYFGMFARKDLKSCQGYLGSLAEARTEETQWRTREDEWRMILRDTNAI